MVLTVVVALVSAAPTAAADVTDALRSAVSQSRAASACGPLSPDGVLDQAALAINKTTDDYINFDARFTPETDPMAVLRDLSFEASYAYTLSGAANTEGNAIKATLLSGWNKLPDCGYTSFGASALYNAKKDLVLTTVVLAG